MGVLFGCFGGHLINYLIPVQFCRTLGFIDHNQDKPPQFDTRKLCGSVSYERLHSFTIPCVKFGILVYSLLTTTTMRPAIEGGDDYDFSLPNEGDDFWVTTEQDVTHTTPAMTTMSRDNYKPPMMRYTQPLIPPPYTIKQPSL